jgi:hypothetical protein
VVKVPKSQLIKDRWYMLTLEAVSEPRLSGEAAGTLWAP